MIKSFLAIFIFIYSNIVRNFPSGTGSGANKFQPLRRLSPSLSLSYRVVSMSFPPFFHYSYGNSTHVVPEKSLDKFITDAISAFHNFTYRVRTINTIGLT